MLVIASKTAAQPAPSTVSPSSVVPSSTPVEVLKVDQVTEVNKNDVDEEDDFLPQLVSVEVEVEKLTLSSNSAATLCIAISIMKDGSIMNTVMMSKKESAGTDIVWNEKVKLDDIAVSKGVEVAFVLISNDVKVAWTSTTLFESDETVNKSVRVIYTSRHNHASSSSSSGTLFCASCICRFSSFVQCPSIYRIRYP
jgi:hypothetical protein